MAVLLLGPLLVESAERLLAPRSRVTRALLAALALAQGEVVSPDRLYYAIWGDRPSPSRVAHVQVAVHRLRQWLAGCGVDSLTVRTVAGRYRLDSPRETDVQRFRALVGQSTRQEAKQRFKTLDDALELWRGPALADVSGSEAVTAAAALERELTQATARCAAAALELGEPDRALTLAVPRAQADLRDESIQAVLIDALSATGQQAAALQAYEAARRRLADELGVDPGERLREAHLRALRHSAPVAAGSVVTPARPNQLPAGIADFAGRRSQLARLRGYLSQKSPVVIIAGMAGVGKTTLAVHIAHSMRAGFPDGQLYVGLRGASRYPASTADVLGQLLRGLGRHGEAIPADADERAALFRAETAGKRLLVVLDDAADEAQVRPLLPAGPGCATLLTSRRTLAALPGAQRVALGVMPPDESVDLLRRIAGTGAPEATARRIAIQCGHLPLALRIAGCKLADRPQRQMAWLESRLDDERRRLDELSAGDLAVRASLTLSYESMDPLLRLMFRRLGLLEVATIGPWLVMAMFDVDLQRAEDCLDALARIHLLETAGHDETGQLRFRFHDLVRLYARERAAAEDPAGSRAEAVSRAVNGYLALAVRAELRLAAGLWRVPVEPTPPLTVHPELLALVSRAPLDWLNAERDNVVTMVRQAADAGLTAQCWSLAVACTGYFNLRTLFDEWRHTHMTALEAARRQGDPLAQATVLLGLAVLATRRDRIDESARLLERARELFARSGNEHGQAVVDLCAAENDRYTGRHGEVLKRLPSIARALRAHGDVQAEMWCLLIEGQLMVYEDRLAEAEDSYRRGSELARDNASKRMAAQHEHHLGLLHAGQSRLDPAIRHFTRSRRLFQELGDELRDMFVCLSLANAEVQAGQLESGVERMRRCLESFHRYGERFGVAKTLTSLGAAHMSAGRGSEAAAILADAAQRWAALGPAYATQAERCRAAQAFSTGHDG